MCRQDKVDRIKKKHKERQEKMVRKKRLVSDNTHNENWQWGKIRKE